jgi:hypothetical protein
MGVAGCPRSCTIEYLSREEPIMMKKRIHLRARTFCGTALLLAGIAAVGISVAVATPASATAGTGGIAHHLPPDPC